MGEWIWQRLTELIGGGTGGKPREVGWDYAAHAAGATPAPVAPVPNAGGQFGPTNAPAGNGGGGGVDPVAWAAFVSANAPGTPSERLAGRRVGGPY